MRKQQEPLLQLCTCSKVFMQGHLAIYITNLIRTERERERVQLVAGTNDAAE